MINKNRVVFNNIGLSLTDAALHEIIEMHAYDKKKGLNFFAEKVPQPRGQKRNECKIKKKVKDDYK